MREEIVAMGKVDMSLAKEEGAMVTKLKVKMMEMMNSEELDEETTRIVKRLWSSESRPSTLTSGCANSR